MLILTCGELLLRADLDGLVTHASSLGMMVVLGSSTPQRFEVQSRPETDLPLDSWKDLSAGIYFAEAAGCPTFPKVR